MSVSARYEEAAAILLRESGCTVRRYRTSMSGIAWNNDAWEIEAPAPRGEVSFGTFAHEIAHHLLHMHGAPGRPRWVEEIEAEEWALDQFDRFGLSGRWRYERNAAAHLAEVFRRAIARRVHPDVISRAAPDWWSLALDCSFRLREVVYEDRSRRLEVA